MILSKLVASKLIDWNANALLALALALSAICSGCTFYAPADDNSTNSHDGQAPVPTPSVNLAKPLEISVAPEDIFRCRKITEIIDQNAYSNARWGVMVISLADGRIVCGKDAQKLFTPASIHKILTTVVALDKLGGDFRWKTSVYSKEDIKEGILAGDLTLYGHGAPDFNKESVGELVRILKSKGLRKIKGDIVGDESFFKGDKLGDGWTWNDIQWYYGAEASALSFNKNLAKITLKSKKPESSSDFIDVSGETKPIQDIEAVGVKRELGQNKVYVWGYGDDLDARIAVDNSALWSAETFKNELEKNGVEVEGKARSANWKSDDKLIVGSANELAEVQSRQLKEIVREMNKDSVNLYAELILRTIGKRFGDEAPDENEKVQKLRGDDSAGASVVMKWLTENNISTGEIKIHDGSGLSRLNLVTPEAIGRALVFASQSRIADDFKHSLPIAGVDGTLRGRLGKASGKILAKTGSIQYVNSLAGFANSNDDSYAFVVFCNNATGASDSSIVVDAIAESLINYRPQ